MMGEWPKMVMGMLDFIVVAIPLAYNENIGRPS